MEIGKEGLVGFILAPHRKRSSISGVIAVVIISNFHFIRDRPLYFLVKGGKRLFFWG